MLVTVNKQNFPPGTCDAIFHTRVVWRTLHKRGKSLTPESKVVIELSRSWSDDCSEVTEDESEEAIMHDIDKTKQDGESIIAGSCDVWIVYEGRPLGADR